MLTDTLLRNLKATGKIYKKFDGDGLHIHVTKTGTKLWHMTYSFEGKRKIISFGKYPYVSLKTAKDLRSEARELLARGIDPGEHKKAKQAARIAKNENSFEVVTREWHNVQNKPLSPRHRERVFARLENNILPVIGGMPIADIKAQDLLKALRPVEARGALETAQRALQDCNRIFRYAIATGRTERNIAVDLRGALTPAKNKHFATITEPKAVGQLLRDIDDYHGSVIVKAALRVAPYVFVRPSELRMATWDEFILDTAEWHIPPHRMKMRKIHIVPLARQVIEILEDLRQYTGDGQFLFPSMRGASRPISDATLLRALRTMGYSKNEMTVHGFRSLASTLLNGNGYNRDWVECQLAHGDRNSVRAAYNHADYLPERKTMMQEWADYLDELRES